MKTKVSLQNIADELQVSKTTVSWVLSNQGSEKRISPATQQKIRQCAERLNYQPNYLARSLNTGKTNTLGLIVPSISDSFYSSIAKSVILEAEKSDYTVTICSSESELEREEKMIRMLKRKQVDGIILAPTKLSSTEVAKLMEERYPFVLFDRYFEELDTNYVIIENEKTSHDLVSELIAKGSRKIAVLTTNPHLKTLNQRVDGYKRALQEAGLPVQSELYGVVPFADYEKHLPLVLDNILQSVPDVDGFFFTTHILALAAFSYFASRRIDINQGSGWASIHSTPEINIIAPKMISAMMPTDKIGQETVRIVTSALKARQENRQLLPTEHLLLACQTISDTP